METIAQERTATPAELADEAARMDRALSGQMRPRTLHAICEQGARLSECPHCGAQPSQVCRRPGGYHLDRFVRAFIHGLLAGDEFAVVLGGLEVFTGSTIIRDGGAR